MKKQQPRKKLSTNKVTIATLDAQILDDVRGGTIITVYVSCEETKCVGACTAACPTVGWTCTS
jgi:hypothetical protein